ARWGGAGPTSYDVPGRGAGLSARLQAEGQGYGTGGHGLVSDRGGDDRYRLLESLTDTVDVVVDDACGCPMASLLALPKNAELFHGQGMSSGGGEGALLDGGGNDRYTAEVDSTLDVTLEDRLSAPQAPPDLRVAGLTPPWLGT